MQNNRNLIHFSLYDHLKVVIWGVVFLIDFIGNRKDVITGSDVL